MTSARTRPPTDPGATQVPERRPELSWDPDGEAFEIAGLRFVPEVHQVISEQGRVRNLEPKVFGVLVCLARRPGELVTREQIFHAVWPGTVVEEGVLFRAISELRRLFDDQARDPKVIETIRSRGYRLIAPVHVERAPTLPPPGERGGEETIVDAAAAASTETRLPERWRWKRLAPTALVLLALLAAIYQANRPRGREGVAPGPVDPPMRPRNRTTLVGAENQPSLSPDGEGVAFTWRRPGDSKNKLGLLLAGDTEPRILLEDTADIGSPAWSPDGRWIAVWLGRARGLDLVLLPVLGGPERVLLSDRLSADHIAWSPDGNSLFTSFAGEGQAVRVHRVVLEDGSHHEISRAVAGRETDRSVTVSPDGRRIAFVRRGGSTYGDIWMQELGDSAPPRLLLEGVSVTGLAWAPTRPWLVFSGRHQRRRGLWALSLDDGATVWLEVDDGMAPTFSADGSTLAFSRGHFRTDLWQVRIPSGEPELLVESSRLARHPALAPDGTVSFASNRDGEFAIWVVERDGSRPRWIASGQSFASRPAWSPDGRRLAYEASLDQQLDIFITDSLDRAQPRRLTHDEGSDRDPAWSADGRYVYFSSNREGPWQIWRMAAAGGPATVVAGALGRFPTLTPDGKWLLYFDFVSHSVRRVPAEGGASETVLEDSLVAGWDVLDASHVVYARRGDSALRVRHLETGADRRFAELGVPIREALDLTASGDRLVFGRLTATEFDVQSLSLRQMDRKLRR